MYVKKESSPSIVACSALQLKILTLLDICSTVLHEDTGTVEGLAHRAEEITDALHLLSNTQTTKKKKNERREKKQAALFLRRSAR